MNKLAIVILAVVLSVAMINDGYPQDNADAPDLETIDGKVVSVDVVKSTITIKFAVEYTFLVPSQTPIFRDLYDIKLSDIKPGNDVAIEHYKDPSGKLVATRIEVENIYN